MSASGRAGNTVPSPSQITAASLIGGMLVVVGAGAGSVLGVVAVLLASINVAGGFRVTQRMLRMFRK